MPKQKSPLHKVFLVKQAVRICGDYGIGDHWDYPIIGIFTKDQLPKIREEYKDKQIYETEYALNEDVKKKADKVWKKLGGNYF